MPNDNGSKSLSREFKRFGNEWFFEHVVSSLYYPIAWLRILSSLLCEGTLQTVLVPKLASLIYAMFLKIKH